MTKMKQRLRAISLAILAGAAAASACTSDGGASAAAGAGQSGAGADSDSGSGGSTSGTSSTDGGTATGQGGGAVEANAGAGGIPEGDDAIVTCTTKLEGAACECRRSVESSADSVPCNTEEYGGAHCFAFLGDMASCRCFRYSCLEDGETHDCQCGGSNDTSQPTTCPGSYAHYCLSDRGECFGQNEPCAEGIPDDEPSVEVPSCAFEDVAPLWKPFLVGTAADGAKYDIVDCALEAAGFPDDSAVGKHCFANSDCGKDFHCIRTKCGPALLPGQDCLNTEECVTNFECAPIDGRKQCYLPRRLDAACDDEHYCYRGLECEDGTCTTAGSSDCNGGCGPCQYFGSEACCYTCKSGTCEQECSL